MSLRLTRLRAGPATGELLVLANSLGTTSRMWDATRARLAARPVLLFELPGHDAAVADRFTWNEVVAAVVDMLDEEGVAGADLLGVSIGGALGLAVAARRPDLLRALVLVNTPIRQASASFWRDRADAVRRDGLAFLEEGTRARFLPPGADGSAAADAVVDDLLALDPHGYAAMCESIAELDLAADAARVHARAVVLSARDDLAVPPSNSDELAATIPGARLSRVETGGHLLPVSRPDLVATIVDAIAARPRA